MDEGLHSPGHPHVGLITPSAVTEMKLVYLADFKGSPQTVNLSISGSPHPDMKRRGGLYDIDMYVDHMFCRP